MTDSHKEDQTVRRVLPDLVRTYLMHRKMMQYPHLADEMRGIFIAALEKKGIAGEEEIERKVVEFLGEQSGHESPEDRKILKEALVDLLFAVHFTTDEIEAHINLARKRDRFRELHRVVNEERIQPGRVIRALRDFCNIPQGDLYISPSEAEGVRVALIDRFISNQLPFIGIAKQHLTIRDIDEMLDHVYLNRRRPGKIGGKAAGMLLAAKIILPRLQDREPDLEEYVRLPESYYFSSGIFSDFIDYNGLHYFRSQKYKTRESIEAEYRNIAELFRKASFPPDSVNDFRAFLERLGEHPIILRSSSLLEDNFGHSFSGKYDSIFLANQGSLETRLEEFMWGLKRVHMSTFGPAPILYRRDHSLLDFDEQMGVLVQKVIGRRFGDYFFPFAAGVAFSRNPFAWTPRIRKEDGLLRIVMGLGTRAVDRVGGDYPRMVPLGNPLLRPQIEARQIMKYSQKMIDVLNLSTNSVETAASMELLHKIDHPDLFYAVSVDEDGFVSAPLFKGMKIDLRRSCITFENFLTKTPIVPLMKKILRKLEQAYGNPVDVEFAWDENRLYLLQCRSLPVRETAGVVLPRDVPADRILFRNNLCLFNAVIPDIEYVVYVDPRAYGRIREYEEKTAVGRVVSRMNRALQDRRFVLFGPGRWGSNDINLGVRVGYQDINRCLALAEIAFEEQGLTPEVSCGTHFFNDLLETGIIPVAIYPDDRENAFNERFLLDAPNLLVSLAPDLGQYTAVVHVLHVPSNTGGRLLHILQNEREQKGMGYFAHAGEDAVGT